MSLRYPVDSYKAFFSNGNDRQLSKTQSGNLYISVFHGVFVINCATPFNMLFN